MHTAYWCCRQICLEYDLNFQMWMWIIDICVYYTQGIFAVGRLWVGSGNMTISRWILTETIGKEIVKRIYIFYSLYSCLFLNAYKMLNKMPRGKRRKILKSHCWFSVLHLQAIFTIFRQHINKNEILLFWNQFFFPPVLILWIYVHRTKDNKLINTEKLFLGIIGTKHYVRKKNSMQKKKKKT